MELLQWAHLEHLPDNRPHRHTFFEVCQVGAHGAGCFLVEGREHRLEPGTVFIARPGMVHQIVNTAVPNMELSWVCFQWTPGTHGHLDGVGHLWQDFAAGEIVATLDSGGRLATQWRALRALAESGPLPGYEVQTAAQITTMLLTIAQIGAGSAAGPHERLSENGISNRTARLAVRYIHDNLNLPLSISEIAGQVYASPRHLTRLFRQFTGVSPAAYIVHARMDRAKGLLAHSERPIKEVAESIGYPDVHHFTRVFTRQIGCPPGEYRRSPESRPVSNIQKPGDLV